MTERFPVSVAAAANIAVVLLAVAAASWAGDANWLFLGVLSTALGSIAAVFAVRYRKWLAATVNAVSAVAGVWMVIVITTFQGS